MPEFPRVLKLLLPILAIALLFPNAGLAADPPKALVCVSADHGELKFLLRGVDGETPGRARAGGRHKAEMTLAGRGPDFQSPRTVHRIESEFLFALCNPGSEKALKREVETMGLGWRLSYQRRGFVTFKSDAPFTLDALAVDLALARRCCLSLGKSATREEATKRVAAAAKIHHARFFERKLQGVPCVGRPKTGELVGTVVELGPDEFWSGLHRHTPLLSPDPAGDSGIEMPGESPSRAWLKLEEATRFFDLEFGPGEIAVEVGCAPGGVVLALLRRGVSVVGVDPAKMAEVVLASAIANRQDAPAGRPWFFHSRKPAALASKRDLGHGVSWFMSDMNQSPEVVLKECARFGRMCPDIRGVLITLKLTDLLQIEEKPRWFAALAALGFTTIRLQQLAVHHKELALLATREVAKGAETSSRQRPKKHAG
jgi:23S rRNA (cytidine2498-2'-O)-methyltransferase